MTTKSNNLTKSLIDYIKDVKPYRTKFRDILSQIIFNDDFNVNVTDDFKLEVNFQNTWGRDDAGGHLLINMSEGSIVDQSYSIPATIFPRFSLNDRLNFGQTPHGDDPATQDLSDLNFNGIPDVEEPWTGGFTPSHQKHDDMIPVSVNIISASQVGPNFVILFDISGETLYGFDHSTIQFTVNGIPYLINDPINITPIGNQITMAAVPGSTTAGSFIPGKLYTILTLGTTDFTSIGGVITVGTSFIATGAGTGTGTAYLKNLEVIVSYLHTGRYAVPYHQGSRVRVDGNYSELGINYVVDHTRSFIQFLPSYWPSIGSNIDINLLKSDKLFICWQDPFAYGTTQDKFTISVNSTPAIVTAGSLLNNITYKILSVGTTDFTAVGAHSNTVGLTFTTIAPIKIAGSFTIGKSYKITSIGSTNFTLIGGVNTVGTIFTATGIGTGSGTALANYDVTTGTGLVAPIALSNLSIPSSSIIVGNSYKVLSIGTTNFTLIGGVNTIGTSFTATGVGTGTGTVAPTMTCSVVFTNTELNTQKAVLTNVAVTGGANVGDVWTLTASSHWTFNVQKTTPLNSTITSASFKTPYNDGVLSFIIDRTWANYYVTDTESYYSYFIEQDANSYVGYDMLPLGISDTYDQTEFFSDLSIVSEHGDDSLMQIITAGSLTMNKIYKIISVGTTDFTTIGAPTNTVGTIFTATGLTVTAGSFIIGKSYTIISVGTTNFTLIGSGNNNAGTTFTATGPGLGTGTARGNYDISTGSGTVQSILQHPVKFNLGMTKFGEVKNNNGNDYTFTFNTIPPAYTYIEFKIEQEGQFNPWVNASITEEAFLTIIYQNTNLQQTINLITDLTTVLWDDGQQWDGETAIWIN